MVNELKKILETYQILQILKTYEKEGYIYDLRTVFDIANNTIDVYYKTSEPIEYIKLNVIVSKSNTSLFDEIVK